MILGTGRSGTTATHYLLAVDPQFRYLRQWKIVDPVPPPQTDTDSMIRDAPGSVSGNQYHIATSMDQPKIAGSTNCRFARTGTHLSENLRKWREADDSTKFVYHERVLRLLHRVARPMALEVSRRHDRLEPLASHYPQAHFVVTHRGPAQGNSVGVQRHRRSHPPADPHWTFDRKDVWARHP